MSIWQVQSKGLSIGPSVSIDEARIRVVTSPLLRWLSLGSSHAALTFDRRQRHIRIQRTSWWRTQALRVVSFDDIDHIDYGYGWLPTSFSYIFPFASSFRWTDTVDRYSIDLVTREGERIAIGRFTGEGSKMNGAAYALLGFDSIIDIQGDQGDRSLELVDILAEVVGVPVGRQLRPRQVTTRACSQCRRAGVPGHSSCQYCGGTIEAVTI